MEEGERVEDQLESSVARQLGRGAVALGRTRPAVGTREEKRFRFTFRFVLFWSHHRKKPSKVFFFFTVFKSQIILFFLLKKLLVLMKSILT